jgi:hypothetical protein
MILLPSAGRHDTAPGDFAAGREKQNRRSESWGGWVASL